MPDIKELYAFKKEAIEVLTATGKTLDKTVTAFHFACIELAERTGLCPRDSIGRKECEECNEKSCKRSDCWANHFLKKAEEYGQ